MIFKWLGFGLFILIRQLAAFGYTLGTAAYLYHPS